ncbi:hypothetical protein ABPG77_005099 [Micractinium sp. CCAP 211/92]
MGLAANSMKRGKAAAGCLGETCKGFRDFLLRGNVVDMAVGIVVGTAFTALVNAFVSDFITPLIAPSGAELPHLLHPRLYLSYGHFINVLLTFIIICFVVSSPSPPSKPSATGGCPSAATPTFRTRPPAASTAAPSSRRCQPAQLDALPSDELDEDEMVSGGPKGFPVSSKVPVV